MLQQWGGGLLLPQQPHLQHLRPHLSCNCQVQSPHSLVFPERAGPGWFTGSASTSLAASHTPQVLTSTQAAALSVASNDPPQSGPTSRAPEQNGSMRSNGSNLNRRSGCPTSGRGAASEAQPSNGKSHAVHGAHPEDKHQHAHQPYQHQVHTTKPGPDSTNSTRTSSISSTIVDNTSTSSNSRDPFAGSNAAMNALKSSSSWFDLASAVAQHANKPWFNQVHASAAITHMGQLTLKQPPLQAKHQTTSGKQQQQQRQQHQHQQQQQQQQQEQEEDMRPAQRHEEDMRPAQRRQEEDMRHEEDMRPAQRHEEDMRPAQRHEEDMRPAQRPSQLVLQLLALVAEWLPKLRGRQASNVLWAMSKLHAARLLPPPSFSLSSLSSSVAHSLGSSTQGTSSRSNGDGSSSNMLTVGGLVCGLAALLSKHWDGLREQELSSAVYALACLSYPAHPRWLAGLRGASVRAMQEGTASAQARESGGSSNPQAMANLLWGLVHLDASLGYARRSYKGSIASTHNPSSNSSSNSFSRHSSDGGRERDGDSGGGGGGASMEQWLRSFWATSLPALRAWPRASLAVAAVCLARIKALPPPSWLSAFYEATFRWLPTMSSQDLANVAWAAAQWQQMAGEGSAAFSAPHHLHHHQQQEPNVAPGKPQNSDRTTSLPHSAREAATARMEHAQHTQHATRAPEAWLTRLVGQLGARTRGEPTPDVRAVAGGTGEDAKGPVLELEGSHLGVLAWSLEALCCKVSVPIRRQVLRHAVQNASALDTKALLAVLSLETAHTRRVSKHAARTAQHSMSRVRAMSQGGTQTSSSSIAPNTTQQQEQQQQQRRGSAVFTNQRESGREESQAIHQAQLERSTSVAHDRNVAMPSHGPSKGPHADVQSRGSVVQWGKGHGKDDDLPSHHQGRSPPHSLQEQEFRLVREAPGDDGEEEEEELFEVYHIVWLLARRLHTQPERVLAQAGVRTGHASTHLRHAGARKRTEGVNSLDDTEQGVFTSQPAAPLQFMGGRQGQHELQQKHHPSASQQQQQQQGEELDLESQAWWHGVLRAHARRCSAEQERQHSRVRLVWLLMQLRNAGLDTTRKAWRAARSGIWGREQPLGVASPVVPRTVETAGPAGPVLQRDTRTEQPLLPGGAMLCKEHVVGPRTAQQVRPAGGQAASLHSTEGLVTSLLSTDGVMTSLQGDHGLLTTASSEAVSSNGCVVGPEQSRALPSKRPCSPYSSSRKGSNEPEISEGGLQVVSASSNADSNNSSTHANSSTASTTNLSSSQSTNGPPSNGSPASTARTYTALLPRYTPSQAATLMSAVARLGYRAPAKDLQQLLGIALGEGCAHSSGFSNNASNSSSSLGSSQSNRSSTRVSSSSSNSSSKSSSCSSVAGDGGGNGGLGGSGGGGFSNCGPKGWSSVHGKESGQSYKKEGIDADRQGSRTRRNRHQQQHHHQRQQNQHQNQQQQQQQLSVMELVAVTRAAAKAARWSMGHRAALVKDSAHLWRAAQHSALHSALSSLPSTAVSSTLTQLPGSFSSTPTAARLTAAALPIPLAPPLRAPQSTQSPIVSAPPPTSSSVCPAYVLPTMLWALLDMGAPMASAWPPRAAIRAVSRAQRRRANRGPAGAAFTRSQPLGVMDKHGVGKCTPGGLAPLYDKPRLMPRTQPIPPGQKKQDWQRLSKRRLAGVTAIRQQQKQQKRQQQHESFPPHPSQPLQQRLHQQHQSFPPHPGQPLQPNLEQEPLHRSSSHRSPTLPTCAPQQPSPLARSRLPSQPLALKRVSSRASMSALQRKRAALEPYSGLLRAGWVAAWLSVCAARVHELGPSHTLLLARALARLPARLHAIAVAASVPGADKLGVASAQHPHAGASGAAATGLAAAGPAANASDFAVAGSDLAAQACALPSLKLLPRVVHRLALLMPVMTCSEMAKAAFAVVKLARIERAVLTAAAPPAASHESTPASHSEAALASNLSKPTRQNVMTPTRSTHKRRAPGRPLPAPALPAPCTPANTTTSTDVSASSAFAKRSSSSSSSSSSSNSINTADERQSVVHGMKATGTSTAHPAVDDALLARFLAMLEASFEVQSASARRGDAHLCAVAAGSARSLLQQQQQT